MRSVATLGRMRRGGARHWRDFDRVDPACAQNATARCNERLHQQDEKIRCSIDSSNIRLDRLWRAIACRPHGGGGRTHLAPAICMQPPPRQGKIRNRCQMGNSVLNEGLTDAFRRLRLRDSFDLAVLRIVKTRGRTMARFKREKALLVRDPRRMLCPTARAKCFRFPTRGRADRGGSGGQGCYLKARRDGCLPCFLADALCRDGGNATPRSSMRPCPVTVAL
jgi:hypothetical protein